MNKNKLKRIVRETAKNFPSFGGERVAPRNPIAIVLKGEKPVFALGVDIEKVVSFVISRFTEK